MMFPNIFKRRETVSDSGKKNLKIPLKLSRDTLLRMAESRSPSSSSFEELQEEQVPSHRVPPVIRELYNVIPGRLAFTVHRCEAETRAEIKRWGREVFFFSSDMQDRFEPYCADFGPVKLSVVYRFCNYLHKKMSDPRLAKRRLAYYCEDNPESIANTAFLLGCYAMLKCNYSPEQAFAAFRRISIPSFRDASNRPADYTISLLDCFLGLKRAMALGWYSQGHFDVDEYEHWDEVANGDLHEVTPRFLAFRGPEAKRGERATCSPESYVPAFEEKGVSAVIRLNDRDTYDEKAFTEKGIRHYDLFFEDCSTPSPQLIKQFLDICDHEEGRIAVHCMAGLGRTGTMIALWMMKKLSWKANEAIAWLRIVRPGSVIGDQQHFLKACEGAQWLGNTLLLSNNASTPEHAITDALGLEAALTARDSLSLRDHEASTTNSNYTTPLSVHGTRRPAIVNRRASDSSSSFMRHTRLRSGIKVV